METMLWIALGSFFVVGFVLGAVALITMIRGAGHH